MQKIVKWIKWLPLTALAALIPFSYLSPFTFVNVPPFLRITFDTFLIGISFLFVAFVALRSFLVSGFSSLLFLGSGTLVFSFYGLPSSWLVYTDPNLTETFTIFSAFGASIFYSISAVTAFSGNYFVPVKHRKRQLGRTVGAILFFFAWLVFAIAFNWMPAFYTPDQGFSVLRQIILSNAIVLFLLSGLVYLFLHSRTKFSFFFWYSQALLLVTVGLTAFLLENQLGGVLSWIGRSTLYTGGIFFIIVILELVYEGKSRQIPWYKLIAYYFHKTEILYSPIVDSSSEAVVSLDIDGNVLTWNPGAERLFGYTFMSVLGKNFYELDIAGDLTKLKTWKNLTPSSKNVANIEILMKNKTGKSFCCEVTFLNNNPMNQDTVIIIKDISARKTAEEKLHRSNSHLKELVVLYTNVEQNIRFQFSSRMHDHLQQILIASSMRLQRGLTQLDHSVPNNNLQSAQQLLQESINEVRLLSLELCPPVLQQASLGESIQWLAKWMQEKHDIEVSLALVSDVSSIVVSDQTKFLIFEIVRELLFNSVKHSQTKKASISISVENPNRVKVIVEDDGVGCDLEALTQKIKATDSFGLFAIRRRLEIIGEGTLSFHSQPGQGFHSTLEFPLQTGQESEEMDLLSFEEMFDQDQSIEKEKPTFSEDKIRILLVDDHHLIRKAFASLLEEENFTVVGEAGDGKTAYEMAARLHPQIILMDINMPVLNGVKATHLIKQKFPAIHIIGLSMHGDIETVEAMKAAGASAYFQKDGDAQELFHTILRLVKEKPAALPQLNDIEHPRGN